MNETEREHLRILLNKPEEITMKKSNLAVTAAVTGLIALGGTMLNGSSRGRGRKRKMLWRCQSG